MGCDSPLDSFLSDADGLMCGFIKAVSVLVPAAVTQWEMLRASWVTEPAAPSVAAVAVLWEFPLSSLADICGFAPNLAVRKGLWVGSLRERFIARIPQRGWCEGRFGRAPSVRRHSQPGCPRAACGFLLGEGVRGLRGAGIWQLLLHVLQLRQATALSYTNKRVGLLRELQIARSCSPQPLCSPCCKQEAGCRWPPVAPSNFSSSGSVEDFIWSWACILDICVLQWQEYCEKSLWYFSPVYKDAICFLSLLSNYSCLFFLISL